MDQLQIRLTRTQIEIILANLEVGVSAAAPPVDPEVTARLYTWLTDRYTRAWGLPPATAAALRKLRPGDEQPDTGEHAGIA